MNDYNAISTDQLTFSRIQLVKELSITERHFNGEYFVERASVDVEINAKIAEIDAIILSRKQTAVEKIEKSDNLPTIGRIYIYQGDKGTVGYKVYSAHKRTIGSHVSDSVTYDRIGKTKMSRGKCDVASFYHIVQFGL